MKNSLLLLCLLSIIAIPVLSQHGVTEKPFVTGDQLSYESLDKSTVKPFQFADCKNKLVILDFWSINCRSCIAFFPKLDSLQKMFPATIEIILVTKNTKEQVEKLFSKIKIKKPSLKMIEGDTYLSTMFPHSTVPHCVIIDQQRIVQYITSGNTITAPNIKAMLTGQRLPLPLKMEYGDFNRKESLLKEGKGRLMNNLEYYSVWMNKLDQFNGSSYGYNTDSTGKKTGLKIVNADLLFFYQVAYNQSLDGGEFDHRSKIVIEAAESEKFQSPVKTDDLSPGSTATIFSYESLVPLSSKTNLFAMLRDDLDRFLPFEAATGTRVIPCLVLYKTSDSSTIGTTGGRPFRSNRDNKFIQRNMKVESFINALSYSNPQIKTPILDETNCKTTIDLIIDSNLNDIPGVRKELRKYGLELKEEPRAVNVLIIKDKNITAFL